MGASGWGEGVDAALARLSAGGVLQGADLASLAPLIQDHFGAGTLGLVWDRIAADGGGAHLEVTPQLHQPAGIVHGGVWCAVIESMASVLGSLQVLAAGRTCVGVHNATDFLRPVRDGRVHGEATPIHLGRTQQLWQVVLARESDGAAVARGQVRLAVIAAGPSPVER